MLRARNYVGAVVGGAKFGAIDGVHMVMLIKVVGPDYAVWDKAATIYDEQPGRTKLLRSGCARRARTREHSSRDGVRNVSPTPAEENTPVALGARPSIGVGRVASAVGPAARRADEAMPQRIVEEAQRGRWPHAAATREGRVGVAAADRVARRRRCAPASTRRASCLRLARPTRAAHANTRTGA